MQYSTKYYLCWPLNTHDSGSNSDQYEHLRLCCCGNIFSPLYSRCRVSGGHVGGGSLKRNLISGIELRSAHSHQPQKLRSALVTGPTEAQLTYSLPVCTAVLHLSVVCLYLFFSCTSSLCSCQLHNGLPHAISTQATINCPQLLVYKIAYIAVKEHVISGC